MCWPLTFYVQALPPTVGGRAFGPFIQLLEKYRSDTGIYAHELQHVKQWAAATALAAAAWVLGCYALGFMQHAALAIFAPLVHQVAYTALPAYKLWAEVQAYRVQAQHYPDDRRPLFAHFIATSYGLHITYQQALAKLKE